MKNGRQHQVQIMLIVTVKKSHARCCVLPPVISPGCFNYAKCCFCRLASIHRESWGNAIRLWGRSERCWRKESCKWHLYVRPLHLGGGLTDKHPALWLGIAEKCLQPPVPLRYAIPRLPLHDKHISKIRFKCLSQLATYSFTMGRACICPLEFCLALNVRISSHRGNVHYALMVG